MKFKFRTLVNRHEQQVYSLALHMLQRREEAEDVAQEVYIKLWQNIGDIELDRAKPWLLKVTRNMCIDLIRAHKNTEDIENINIECTNVRFQPAKALANCRLSQWLKAAIDTLKEPYQSLIVMSDIQHKSQGEIAETMELSINQVKVYIHRARQQLRTQLQKVKS